MSEPSTPAVLHLTTAVGGGVDRYIRDTAAATSRRHFVWHAGASIDVIEDVAARRFVPLRDVTSDRAAAPALATWRRDNAIGILHVHSVDRAARARLALADASLPAIATLHDIGFVAPHAFEAGGAPEADSQWIAEVGASLARVEAIVVPSDYIRHECERVFGGKTIVGVAPGIAIGSRAPAPIAPPPEFAARAPRPTVAIVGAIGPHKGSDLVDALAIELAASNIGLVVIGYTDRQLVRGWAGGHYYVHGPYADAELPALFDAYRVDLVLFPNRIPESFSYTLSEAWASRIPVIVPDAGALGERVARHGGGWRLAAGFGAGEAAALIRRLFGAQGEAERARVKSQIDPHAEERVPTLASMSRALDRLYERFAVPAQGTSGGDAALAPLLAANLDGFVFRAELLKLAEELADARAAIAPLEESLAQTRAWAQKAEANAEAWAAKLERDIEALQREVKRRDDELAQLPAMLRAWLLRKRAFRDRR